MASEQQGSSPSASHLTVVVSEAGSSLCQNSTPVQCEESAHDRSKNAYHGDDIQVLEGSL